MTHEAGQDDVSPRTLRRVERAGQSGLLRALGAPFVRANSPAYVQLDWAPVHLSTTAEDQIMSQAVTATGDPSVGFWRKWASLWPNAHLLTANWNAIDGLVGDDPDARQFAGYITTDRAIHVGVLPENKPFGTLPEEAGTATVAFRQGRNASQLIMGVLRGSGELVVPEGLQILSDADGAQPLIPVADLATQYPGTPLA